MFETQSLALYEMLHETAPIEPEKLDELYVEHQESGKSLGGLIDELAVVDTEVLLQSVAEYLGWEYMHAIPTNIDDAIIGVLEGSIARMYAVVPIRFDETTIDLLVTDPFNSQIVDDLTFALQRDVRLVVSNPEAVENLLKVHYGEEDGSIDDLLKEFGKGSTVASEELSESDIEAMAGETPIVRFVNLVLLQAVKDEASDIHFEPFEDEFKIRYRIDGALYEMAPPPVQLALPIISRIKVVANLNIAERRVPQDGRIKITVAGRSVDLRVSTLPTQFGESVVLRVLDRSVVQLDVEKLGMPKDVSTSLQDVISRPNGIVIVTGPTGSGKTTTLYSCLRILSKIDRKLLTAEDPVEYEIEGIMQVSINPHIGLTFAKTLRSFLRQDPDVIMVGEIRDLETAQIGIQASLTGHLVLSTLHTNDAAGAITRLVDMGVEPFLIASSLEAVLAQRLVRKICKECRTSFDPNESLVGQLDLKLKDLGNKEFFYGKGCHHCNETGYRGRMGLYEMLRMSEPLRDMVSQNAPALLVRKKALEGGMRTLRDDGLKAIFNGETSIEEVIKYT
ncbi:MAG: Flp pilus assembly complex ATPase component TadA [Opitutaceae bacterium]|nr:Flp pilus assembly complex ATPase component TadA [Opitutaceae bacterium]